MLTVKNDAEKEKEHDEYDKIKIFERIKKEFGQYKIQNKMGRIYNTIDQSKRRIASTSTIEI